MLRSMALFLIVLLCSCKERLHQYNGYIDADLTYLSSDFPGRLTQLFVHRGQTVQKDQLVFKLEQTSEQFNVAMSQFNQDNLLSQKKEILSQISYGEINYARILKMRKQNAASQNDLDVAKKDLDVLKDQLNAIDFQIKSSQVAVKDKYWQVKRKENHATDSGIIFDTFFTKDEYVQAGQPVLALITKQHIKAVFFVPEQVLSQITLNAKVNLSSDGNPKLATGRINYISNIAQYTPPVIYSREDRQNLVFRVEAGIDSPNLNQIHLGQPITLEIVG